MAEKLYLDCQSGISGDMMVAALLDLGADENILRGSLESLPLEGYEIEIGRVNKSGIEACDFLVKLDSEHENHDHNMEYLHGEGHEKHEKPHMHRGFPEVKSIINSGKLTKNAKILAIDIFRILGEAEAKAHGTTLDQVHFHEVGAVDSIVDIVASAVCLDNLGVKEAVIPVLCEGTGMVRCQHGLLSIPVPAVANIIEKYHLAVQMTSVQGELITPTGAAIAAAIFTSSELPGRFSIKKTGVGAGKREYERPSLLRAMLIDTLGEPEEEEQEEKDTIFKLECNVDDCAGEAFGYCMEKLFAEGAKDVFYTPVYMKKNRPAYEVSVICEQQDVEKMEAILFTETTTIGIRRLKMERTILKRDIISMDSSFGPVKVKVCEFQDTKWGYPEYESIKKIAMENGVSYLEVYKVVYKEISDLMDSYNKR